MGRSYKVGIFRPLSILLLACFLTMLPLAALADPDVYTVEGVKVDVTAENAARAREKAFGQAQQAAFRQLAEQMLPESELADFKVPEVSVISPMIKDFEITQEQLSHVRYIGTYTFRFKNADVRKYFSKQGVTYTDVSRKPLLVLPYFQLGSRTVLWGESNPWLAAWANQKSYRGLVPVTVPIGDLEDVSDIGNDYALSYDPEGLARMVKRYGAGEALVLLAAPLWLGPSAAGNPDALDILVYATDQPQPQLVNRLRVEADANDQTGLFRKAAKEAHKLLEQDWKKQTLVDPAQGNNLKVLVRFNRMEEWVETQKTLRRVRGVSDVKLISLSPREAEIELVFQGSEQRLRLALAQSDMTLTTPQVDFSGYAQSPLIYELYLNKNRRGSVY